MNPGDKLIKKPVYPGGRKAMAEFILNELTYPEKALKNKIEGMVIVKIDIDDTGKVIRAKIKKSVGHGCDEEAIRIVKLLKFYVTKMRKVRLTHHKTIKINFILPKKKPAIKKGTQEIKPATASTQGQSFEVVYTFVPTKE